MFVARIELRIQSEHHAAFRSYALTEGREARGLDGCVDYSFCEDVADPTRVLLYEEWSSRAAFEAYRASPTFKAAGEQLRPMLSRPPRSAYYDADDVFSACAVAK